MNTNTTQSREATSGNFLQMLQHKSGGVSLAELDHELSELVRAVVAQGGTGTLTYKIKIKRNAKAGIAMHDTLEVKTPKAEVGVSFFFAGDNGELLKNDPNQTLLPLRVISDDSAPGVAAAAKLRQANG
jgi:hypothetical protein